MAKLVWRGAVSGLSYNDYGALIPQLNVGTELALKRVKNPYDDRAVGVFLGQDQVGWIPKSENQSLSAALSRGKNLYATITNHDLTGDFSKRLFIQVYETGTETETGIDPRRTLKSTQTQENTMLDKVLDVNKKAIRSASYLEAGRLANNQLNKVIAKKLPIMMRGYADTTIGRMVMANLAQMALQQFRPNDQRVATLGQAMVTEAYGQMIREFDIEGMVAELLKSTNISKAVKALDQAQVEEND